MKRRRLLDRLASFLVLTLSAAAWWVAFISAHPASAQSRDAFATSASGDVASNLGGPVLERVPDPPPASSVAPVAAPAERSVGAVGYEILGGLLGYALGLAPIYPLLMDDSMDSNLAVLIPVTVPLGVALGIWAPGELSGGNGGFGWTFLGQALGGLASVPVAFLALASSFDSSDNGGALAIGVLAVISFPLIGGVLGYELSNNAPRVGATAVAARRASAMALRVGAAPLAHGGGTVTLLGSF